MSRVQDYASLCQAIVDFTHRPTIAPFCDYFIQDGEDLIYRKVLELNEGNGLRWMEMEFDETISGGGIAVPDDYLAPKEFHVVTDSGTYDIEVRDPGWIYSQYPMRSASGIPGFMAREKDSFIFGPYPDSAYEITGLYYGRAAALSAQNTTTWMTTNMPMTLLTACLIGASKFLKDTDAEERHMQELTDRLTGIVNADTAERFGGPLVIRAS